MLGGGGVLAAAQINTGRLLEDSPSPPHALANPGECGNEAVEKQWPGGVGENWEREVREMAGGGGGTKQNKKTMPLLPGQG